MKINLKRKAKGFTLIELIAVIVILGIVITIGINSISKTISSSKEKLYNEQIDRIINISKTWAIQNTNKLPEKNEIVYVTLQNLKDENLLNGDIINPIDDSKIDGCVKITNNDSKEAYTYDYFESSNCPSFDTIYNISYNLNGGTLVKQNPTSYTIRTSTFTLNNPTKTGYYFVGWQLDGTTETRETVKIYKGSTGNKSYTALWQVASSVLTINPNGGIYEGSSEIVSYTKAVGANVDIKIPEREGYTFIGWTVEAESGELNEEQDLFTIGTTDATLTANWKINPYILTVNPNGGGWNGSTNLQTFEMYSNDTKTITNPARDGYTFNGWTLSGEASSFQNGTFTMGTGNATLTANWVGTSYEITYNCNGGSGSTAKSTHTYGVEKNLTKNGCYKLTTGSNGMIYIMEGWATTSSATTPIYNDEQSVLDVGNVTLYAVWKNLFTYSGSKYVINDGNGKWRVKFLSTGSKQLVMNYTTNIDIFLVGGGSALGGGGKTKTVKGREIQAGTYSIVVGAGGTVSSTNGGTTSAFGQSVSGGNGTSGGSGAGGSGYVGHGGDGGAYGSDGGMYKSDGSVGPGSGQGTTTCEFGQGTTSGCYSGVDAYGGGGGGGAGSGCTACVGSDPRKDLVAEGGAGGAGGGGNGSGTSCTNGTANTGGGAGLNRRGEAGCSGGSGIVIIRNAR